MKYFWLAIFVVACTTEPESVPSVQQPAATEVLPALPPGHPEPSLGVRSRGPRRMSVEQIERSLDQIGLLPEGTVKIPDDLAVTLGRPDYQKVTEESLQPSPLFMKFMMDLGAIICTNLALSQTCWGHPRKKTSPSLSLMRPYATSEVCQRRRQKA